VSLQGLGARIAADVRGGAADGLDDASGLVRARTIENLPVGDPADDPDEAVALRDHVNITRHDPGYHTVSVDTAYAAKQHEDRALKHPRGGGPKFLEDALKQTVGELEGIVAGRVRARVQRRR